MFYECFKNEGFLYIMHCRPKKYRCVCVLIWLPIHTKCKRFLPLWVIDLFEWIRSRNNLNKIYKYGYVQRVHHCCSLLFTKISIIYQKKGTSLLVFWYCTLSLSLACAHTHTHTWNKDINKGSNGYLWHFLSPGCSVVRK